MKNFIVIFREPDGRTREHSSEEMALHQSKWNSWLEKYGKQGKVPGGSGLTLNGRMITGSEATIEPGIHKVGTEIIGGFLLLKADDLNEAADIARSCPIFEFGGYAEVREMTQ